MSILDLVFVTAGEDDVLGCQGLSSLATVLLTVRAFFIFGNSFQSEIMSMKKQSLQVVDQSTILVRRSSVYTEKST